MPQLTMRTSERRMLKRCETKWNWAYNDQLHPLQEKAPLWFGQAVHLGLADYYQPGKARGPHPAESFVRALEDGTIAVPAATNEEGANELAEHYELGVDMLNRYIDTFGEDENWECIQPEMKMRMWIPDPRNPANKKWFLYVATMDGVFRYIGPSEGELVHGSIWLFEHKTAASIQVHHLPLDDQAGSYWALAGILLRRRGILKEDEEISGIMYNFLRKAADDKRPMNADGFYCNKPVKQDYLDQMTAVAAMYDDFKTITAKMKVDELAEIARKNKFEVYGEPSKIQPAPYFERIPIKRSLGERRTMLKRIQAEGLRKEALTASPPLLPLLKNPTKDCAWECEFFWMCQLHEAGEDWEEFRDVTFKKWNPYGEHADRKSA
jgi:hypothetical protein